MTSNSKTEGRFGKQDFRYVVEEDANTCPRESGSPIPSNKNMRVPALAAGESSRSEINVQTTFLAHGAPSEKSARLHVFC
jgi:hypothetical protein